MKAQRKIGILAFVFTTWVGLALTLSAFAQLGTAPDATGTGPLTTTSAEYRFPASIDPDIIAGRATEVWARVYRPVDLSGGPFPLLVFLHGNHATCGRGSNPRIDDNCNYTTSGSCPAGYVVTPNHLGYTYMADRLASWGYIVVSINANRGITCGAGVTGDLGLNLARGRLVLRHLQRLSEWNQGISPTPATLGFDMTGLLDFNSVGLMGHSRGGEGVRAAYNLYRDAGSPWVDRIPDAVNIQSIFEVGPVDGQTSRILNADGTVWNVLLPMCDGDVSDLQGVKPFDRMLRVFDENPTQKSSFTVWGANHNYYNTEWQQSDSPGCQGPGNISMFSMPVGSPNQRQTSLASVLALFRGNVGPAADPTFNQNFNPQYQLPAAVTSVTRVDRGYSDSPNSAVTLAFEDFTPAAGMVDSSGITLNYGGVTNHSPVQRAALISWNTPGGYFLAQGNGTAVDINTYQTLDMRLSRQSSALNPAGPTNFSVSVLGDDGALYGPVQLSDYTDLRGPVGGIRGGLHPILQTVRIPLADFGIATNVAGVQLTFDDTATGAIYLANIRFSTLNGLKTAGAAQAAVSDLSESESVAGLSDYDDPLNVIAGIRRVPTTAALNNQSGVEIEVLSNREFPVRDELVTLRVGDQECATSRYADDGDTHALTFTLSGEEFAKVSTGDLVTVQYGRGNTTGRWIFGRLDKSLLK